ncbi:MAG: HNH endonuclease [Ruminococcus sp.]|nr:HNH endonuclease [Ruminococcus sp.]
MAEDWENEGKGKHGGYGYRNRGFENVTSNHGWYTCTKCGKKFRKGDMDIDHILPKSRGGDDSRDNLQCICKHCNRSKRDSTIDTKKDLKVRRKENKRTKKGILKAYEDVDD